MSTNSSLTSKELEILAEIERWEQRDRDGGLLQQAFRTLTLPVDWALTNSFSASVLERFTETIFSTLNSINSVAGQTLGRANIEKSLNDAGVNLEQLRTDRSPEITDLDPIAQSCLDSNSIVAALQGGGVGFGGMAFIVADLPMLLGVNFRLIQQVALVYGYDPESPAEIDVAFKIFEIAGTTGDQRKTTLLELNAALATLRNSVGRLGASFLSKVAVQQIAKILGQSFVKRKLGQLIPLVGVAVGAGVNYSFTKDVGETAFHIYRKRYLLDKKSKPAAGSHV